MNRRRLGLAAFGLAVLAVQIALGLLLARIYLSERNTLLNNGRWSSSKTLVARALMGATSFVTERQALARNSLDLGAWHGYQEVLLAEPAPVERLTVDLHLDAGAWLVVYLDKPETGSSTALRLGTTSRLSSVWLEVSPEGEFLGRQPAGVHRVPAGNWLTLRLDYAPGAVEASLDGRGLGRFPLPDRPLRRIGFRGSGRSARVDNVEIRGPDATRLHETFDGPRHAGRIQLAIVGAVLGLNLVLGACLYRPLRARGRAAAFVYAMVSMTLVVIAALVLGFLALEGRSYPLAEDLEPAERRTRQAEIQRVRAEVRRRYGGRSPAPAVHRVLLVGSSQTWGSGASDPELIWGNVLEARLNGDPALAGPFECINAGISSARAIHLSAALEKDWLELEPDVVVITLAINDSKLEPLTEHVGRMIELSRAAGARPVLVLEPVAPEHDREPGKRHAALRQIGDARQVPVIEMHRYLESRQDDGFLWWDLAHLTDFGQRLFAEHLHRELARRHLLPLRHADSGPPP